MDKKNFSQKLTDTIASLHAKKIRIEKDNQVLMNIPMTFVIALLLFAFPLTLFGSLILMFTGYRFNTDNF